MKFRNLRTRAHPRNRDRQPITINFTVPSEGSSPCIWYSIGVVPCGAKPKKIFVDGKLAWEATE